MIQRAKLKRIRQNLIVLLTAVLVMLGMFELLLRIFDPLGVNALFGTLFQISQQLDHDDPRGFGLPPGRYVLPGGWVMTVDDERNRVTPNTQPSDCDIVFVGDSVTMGQGVQDDEVWINLLAAESDAEFINAGFSGYNIYHVINTLEHREGDGYVYLMLPNDTQTGVPFEGRGEGHWAANLIQRHLLRATYTHVALARTGGLGERPNTDDVLRLVTDVEVDEEALAWYFERLTPLLERDDVLVLAIEGDSLTTYLVERYGDLITPVQSYTQTISWADSHASAVGNRELAQNAATAVNAFAEAICEIDE